MRTIVLEIRDEGTHIPALAIRMKADNTLQNYYIHGRCGYHDDGSGIVVMKLGDQQASVDPYSWGGRTMPAAHNFIYDNFDSLNDGDVVDVRVILGETTEPAKSERLT